MLHAFLYENITHWFTAHSHLVVSFLVSNDNLFYKLANIAEFNPYLTNRLSHHYHLGESTFYFRGFRCDFKFLSHFSTKFLRAYRIAPDGTPHSAASHLGLYCLPMSHKKDARLIQVK